MNTMKNIQPSGALPLRIWAGLFGLGLAVLLLVLGLPLMKTWFYCFAWWPLILVLDGLNLRLTGDSPLSRGARDFLFTAAMSILVWLLFELFNLRLQNWSYHGLPAARAERWLGYSLAFATVIPALQQLSRLVEALISGPIHLPFRIRSSPRVLAGLSFAGLFILALPLFRPALFFPMVWIGFILLVDPLNRRLGNPSFLSDLERGDGKRLLSWAAAGLAAGILWELLNFWAGTHWEYHLPYLDFGRVFQMPVFGYLGFIPFALEVFALFEILTFIRRRSAGRPALRGLLIGLALVTAAGVFILMDRFTLR